MLRCRFSVSYLPTPPSSLEAEENDVTAIRRRLRKEAKSFSLTREFQDFKVYLPTLRARRRKFRAQPHLPHCNFSLSHNDPDSL